VEDAASSDGESDVNEDYVSAYDLARFAESARFVRHYPEQKPVLRDLLPTIATPTQTLAGRDGSRDQGDEFVSAAGPMRTNGRLDGPHRAVKRAVTCRLVVPREESNLRLGVSETLGSTAMGDDWETFLLVVALGVSQSTEGTTRCWPQSDRNSAEELEPLLRRSDRHERLQDLGVSRIGLGVNLVQRRESR
jgi:hypothetical protein